MILFFVRNPLDEASWERVEADDMLAAIRARYPIWPSTARIYGLDGIGTPERAITLAAGDGLAGRDLTPSRPADIARLADHPGPLLITIPPADPVTAIIAVAATIVAIAAAYLLVPRPQIPSAGTESSNRSLTERSNRARPNARIPDIFGTVRSVPDLLTVPYRRFENNVELEVSFMCVGRGAYDIDDVRDGDTMLSNVAGAAAEFYGPGTSPNRGDDAQLSIGGLIGLQVETIVAVSGVNGQLLRAPNNNNVQGKGNIRFVYPDRIETNGSDIDFTDLFDAGDNIAVDNADAYNGNYQALAVAAKAITLANPANSNAAWATNFGSTAYGDAILSVSGNRWTGPFVLDLDDFNHLITNFVALGGLYRVDSKGRQTALTITLEIELTPIDQNDQPSGAAQLFQLALVGSKADKDQVGATLDASPTFTGRCQVRARRVTAKDLKTTDTIVDDVKWRDAYAAASVGDMDFGNVTTVLARTYATSGATSVKERKLNLSARRRVPRRMIGTAFSDELYGSDDLAEIASAICLDPFIGGRSRDEVDFDSLYSASAAIAAYFATDLAKQFSYTFDDDNLSFEETIQIVAGACFCHAYRQGRVIKLKFEQATEDSSLLFNHRNIIPASQKRTVRFGVLNDQDGVELEYQVPKDGAKLTISLPADRVPTSPRKVEVPGIGNAVQARLQAERAWNRMRFQNIATEFEATQEAAMVLPQDRVLVVDVTRPDYLSGDIEDQDGTRLALSHAVALDPATDYQVFLQLADGTTQSLACTGVADDPQAIDLASLPRLPLVVDFDRSARTTFTITPIANVDSRAFLVTEREPQSGFTETVRAGNYSFLIYQADQLTVWLAMTGGQPRDDGAFSRSVIYEGSGQLVGDPYRERVLQQAGGSGFKIGDPVSPTSYTKTAWINGSAPSIIGSTDDLFGLSAGIAFMQHDKRISAPVADGWRHVAAAFDQATGLARLYVDGALKARTTLVAMPVGEIRALDQLYGRADDVRLYQRALSGDEIGEIYRASIRAS